MPTRRGRREAAHGGARHPGPGFVTIPETLNAVDAWLSSIPGNAYAVRQPIVSTLNLAHMMPVSARWAGPGRTNTSTARR
jgi:type IV secretory pathway VirB4 component